MLHCSGRLRAHTRSAGISLRAHAARQPATPPKTTCCIAEGNAVIQALCSSISTGNVAGRGRCSRSPRLHGIPRPDKPKL